MRTFLVDLGPAGVRRVTHLPEVRRQDNGWWLASTPDGDRAIDIDKDVDELWDRVWELLAVIDAKVLPPDPSVVAVRKFLSAIPNLSLNLDQQAQRIVDTVREIDGRNQTA